MCVMKLIKQVVHQQTIDRTRASLDLSDKIVLQVSGSAARDAVAMTLHFVYVGVSDEIS